MAQQVTHANIMEAWRARHVGTLGVEWDVNSREMLSGFVVNLILSLKKC